MTEAPITDGAFRQIAARLTVTGRVQGVGVRPAVARFAQKMSLSGTVGNTREGVVIHVEGSRRDVELFERDLPAHLPVAAELSTLRSVRVRPLGFDTFIVRQATNQPADISERDGSRRNTLSAVVPPDVVICEKCLVDIQNSENRRNGYPFTSCTNCGPRYSVIDRMPFERAQTSMVRFPLCRRCREEYQSPVDRRFHAQTTACPACGPRVWLRDRHERIVARGDDAVAAAALAVLDGRILTLRGLGGYQMLVDASSQEGVARLRDRKQRRAKPFAVMVPSVAAAEELARLDDVERQLLQSPSGPVVVVAARSDAILAPCVTDGLNTIGLMLPTTPLHWLLLNLARRPLVCTSANVQADPLIFTTKEAIERLRGIADVWLEHDRPIRRPIDDSVTRVMAGKPATIRLARGYAPLPLQFDVDRPLMALGGHQKTAVALCNGAQTVLGPHIGDLDSVAARQRFVEQMADLADLYGTDDCQFVGDQHPEYYTSQWADSGNHRLVQIQHHHAHIAAGMAENGWLDRQVLGVSFDGTGLGNDGTIWGGEFLLATAAEFKRVGHLRPFSLPGGERSVREPWRVATALVCEAAGEEQAARLPFQTGDVASLLPVVRSPRLSPTTTSAGRLFDGVAALVLGIEQCQFEGQAAMLLESACPGQVWLGEIGAHSDQEMNRGYSIPIRNGPPKQLDWRPLVRQILHDRVIGVSPAEMAMRFHRGLANAVVQFCGSYAMWPVVLGGGVFQNRVLVELLSRRFAEVNRPLGLPGIIPTNDGGLAAGQLAVAAALTQKWRAPSCV